jgi:MFS family permease
MSSPFSGRWSLLAFGFAMAFFSSFGQTSFIAVFGGALRAEFDLSNGAWGTVYFLATLTSGVLITKAGGLIDAVPLRRYAMTTIAGLGGAALLASASQNALILTLALFLLRFFGQGLMGHVALTTMAREFEAARGRAIAIATMGFPAGEAVFPLLGAVALAAFGWRGGWLLASLVCILVVLPLAPILLGTHGRDLADARKPFAALRFLAQRDMLLALPAFMTSGFVSTAIAFHQVLIAQSKGWPPTLFAASFAMFGVSSILSGLASGWLVDKFGARRLALGFLLPSGTGCLILAAFESPLALFAYMALHGVTNGSYATVTTSLLAEARMEWHKSGPFGPRRPRSWSCPPHSPR